MAAITGFFMSKIAQRDAAAAVPCSPGASPRPRATRSKVRRPPERSAPAQNARPGPGDDHRADRVVGVGLVEAAISSSSMRE